MIDLNYESNSAKSQKKEYETKGGRKKEKSKRTPPFGGRWGKKELGGGADIGKRGWGGEKGDKKFRLGAPIGACLQGRSIENQQKMGGRGFTSEGTTHHRKRGDMGDQRKQKRKSKTQLEPVMRKKQTVCVRGPCPDAVGGLP